MSNENTEPTAAPDNGPHRPASPDVAEMYRAGQVSQQDIEDIHAWRREREAADARAEQADRDRVQDRRDRRNFWRGLFGAALVAGMFNVPLSWLKGASAWLSAHLPH